MGSSTVRHRRLLTITSQSHSGPMNKARRRRHAGNSIDQSIDAPRITYTLNCIAAGTRQHELPWQQQLYNTTQHQTT